MSGCAAGCGRSPAFGAGDGGYYGWLGRMASYKGPREAIEIARRAGVALRLAGKIEHEDEAKYFQEQVEPLLGGDIEYIGEIGPDERAAFLGGAIALLNPITWSEPFGLTMVESLACGTPVVAFPRGSVPEIVEDGVTGLLCADADVMVERLPEAARLDRSACRKAVEGHFSAARMVDDHLALYAQLIEDVGVRSLARAAAPTASSDGQRPGRVPCTRPRRNRASPRSAGSPSTRRSAATRTGCITR